jgi:predicted nucleic acid-binding Zn ribbon protein
LKVRAGTLVYRAKIPQLLQFHLGSRAIIRYNASMPKPVRHCANLRCFKPLPWDARADARFCSAACRALRRRTVERIDRAYGRNRSCAHCGGALLIGLDMYREDKRYCSARCRQAAHRKRKALDIEARIEDCVD